jgi:hypothetical protein
VSARSAATFIASAMLLVGCRPSAALPDKPGLPPARDTTSEHGPAQLAPIPAARLCVTAGRIVPLRGGIARVDVGGMRGIVGGDTGQAAEIAFTYGGPSATTTPLANGELRRQIGLKLRAKDTCNVVYVMWHISPHPGVAVSVKYNPGRSTHDGCGAGGYETVQSGSTSLAPAVRVGDRHTLRAELDGQILRVTADTELVFEAPLPAEAFRFDGPAGVRSDNGRFDFELRVPTGRGAGTVCP